MRKLLMALLATAAAVPAIASAQDHDRGDRRARLENRGGDGVRPDRGRIVQPDRATPAEARAPRTDAGGRDWYRARITPAPAAQPAQRVPTVAQRPADAGARRNWNADDNGARRGWSRNDSNRDDRTRNWSRGDGDRNDAGRDRGGINDGRNDWRRPDNARGDARRNWSGNTSNRGDWNRGNSWDRNDSWNRNNGWNRNDGRNGNYRAWDRSWRNNDRYDWQRYRSSNRYAFRLARYAAPYDWNYGYRRFAIGASLSVGLFAQDYWISDPWAYRLPPTSWPYQWVRYYNDALLVDTRSGYVVDVIPEIFWD